MERIPRNLQRAAHAAAKLAHRLLQRGLQLAAQLAYHLLDSRCNLLLQRVTHRGHGAAHHLGKGSGQLLLQIRCVDDGGHSLCDQLLCLIGLQIRGNVLAHPAGVGQRVFDGIVLIPVHHGCGQLFQLFRCQLYLSGGFQHQLRALHQLLLPLFGLQIRRQIFAHLGRIGHTVVGGIFLKIRHKILQHIAQLLGDHCRVGVAGQNLTKRIRQLLFALFTLQISEKMLAQFGIIRFRMAGGVLLIAVCQLIQQLARVFG